MAMHGFRVDTSKSGGKRWFETSMTVRAGRLPLHGHGSLCTWNGQTRALRP